MPYEVEIDNRAAFEIRKLERSVQQRVLSKIDELAEQPRPDGVVKLKGDDDLYRVRVGNFRVVYQINDKGLVVLVVRVADRKDVYRR